MRTVKPCNEVTEMVTAYLEGAMPFWTRMGISMHILMCAPCRRYFRQIRQLAQATGSVPELEMPADVQASMNELFKRAAELRAEESQPGVEIP